MSTPTTHQHLSGSREVTTLEGRPVRVEYGQIIGTDRVVFRAWEHSGAHVPHGVSGGHSTISTLNSGRWWGAVSSRRLPSALEALPARSEQRWKAVREWQEQQHAEAAAYVVAAFPALAGAATKDGEVVVSAAVAEAAVAEVAPQPPAGSARLVGTGLSAEAFVVRAEG